MACVPDSKTIILVQIPFIEQIIRDECWYAGEKLHHEVKEQDIEEVICKIIQREGINLRKRALEKIRTECDNNCKQCKFWSE
jgi:hypothetical protein